MKTKLRFIIYVLTVFAIKYTYVFILEVKIIPHNDQFLFCCSKKDQLAFIC